MQGDFTQRSRSTATPRRGFLAGLAATGAALGINAINTRDAAAAGLNSGRSAGASAADPAFEAWLGRIKGAHRQVFDAPAPNEGLPAIWPRVYMNTMNATYGTAPGVTAVVILRHSAIGLAMNDALWAKYGIGEQIDVKDGDKPATRNVYANITDLPLPGLGIQNLLKDGVLIGACDVALTIASSGAATKMGLDPAAVKKEWIAGLFPGVQVVPSGVMAVGRAQEMRCTYCFAG
jgi:hypothetical protein